MGERGGRWGDVGAVPGTALCDADATSAHWSLRGTNRLQAWPQVHRVCGRREGRGGALWAGSHWRGFSAAGTVSVSMVVVYSGGANYLSGKLLG